MAIIRKSLLSATLAVASTSLTVGAFADGVTPPARVLGPLKAGIFQLGPKQALTYYENERNACKVTVLLTEAYNEHSADTDTAVRFKTLIGAGTSTRLETNAGPSLALVCAPGAATLFVQTVDHVAYVAPAK